MTAVSATSSQRNAHDPYDAHPGDVKVIIFDADD